MANLMNFQYMLHGKHKPLKIGIEGFQLESAKSVNLLGITIDHNLTFDTYDTHDTRLVRKLKASAELEMPCLSFFKKQFAAGA